MSVQKSNKNKLRHILSLSKNEKIDFLNSFDFILSDCDGVIWLMLGEIPMTGPAINLLKSFGKKYKFISNNSMRTDLDYIKKLENIGVMNVQKKDIVHPVKTIIRYLRKNEITKPIFTIADKVFDDALRDAGFDVIEMDINEHNSLKEFSGSLPVHEKAGAVVFDVDCNMNFSKLIKAQLYLEDPECEFLVGASDTWMALSEDLTVLGPGSFVNMLKKLTGKEPVILGKPGKLLGKFLIENYNINEASRALFIGDALAQDIDFGNKCGFQTLLVLSGATSLKTAKLLDEKKKPDYYADSMADFIDFFHDIVSNY